MKNQLFSELGLPSELVSTLKSLGYDNPTPVQAESIPVLLKHRDLIAHAQTGTGKTAAFALPALTNIDIKLHETQTLVIAPTRELAIQVAEAFKRYAQGLKGFQVTSIYGGQEYGVQLRALKKGPQVVVGTPGRLMDHLRRGTLSLDAIKTVVLDEADEMLKMGFIDDIEWILEQIPQAHQTALFSATMPKPIQKIAKRYLSNPINVTIEAEYQALNSIEQSYLLTAAKQKFQVLIRLLTVEDTEATIIFTRTKQSSSEVAEKLQARGFVAAALNGDMAQASRKKVIERIKSGELNVVVATDVAARGIDVSRMSHVINYDMPADSETYIHRIGRTGRAGRSGKAFLFVTSKENRALTGIKREVGSALSEIKPPSIAQILEKQQTELAKKVVGVVAKSKKLAPYQKIVDHLMQTHDLTAEQVAVAVTYLLQQDQQESLTMLETPKADAKKPRSRRSKPDFKNGSYKSKKKTSGGKKASGGKKTSSRKKISGAKKGSYKDKKTTPKKGKSAGRRKSK